MPVNDRLIELRRLAEAEPDDALTHFLLGRETAERGLFEEARGAFATAIEIDPGYSAAYRHLGNCLERLDRAKEAADTYRLGADVASSAGDIQAGKEMRAFLKRLERSC